VRWLEWADATEDGAQQGIDLVELLPAGASGAPRLVVHLQLPIAAPFTAAAFRVTGTTRGEPVVLAVPSPQPAGLPPRCVAVDLAVLGDEAEYVITLVADPGGRPVHPFFATATFAPRLDRDRGDWRSPPAPAPAARDPRPAVDLLTKDFTGFVRLLSEWVKVKNAHWADLSPASLERVLLEDLAHHGDLLSYYQDRVGNEAFLEDATQRHSARQHSLLLGASLADGAAAESVVAFTAQADGFVPAGTEITTALGGTDAPVVFHTAERTRVVAEHSRLALAAWPGARTAAVPAGATELLLWGHTKRLAAGQRLAVVQGTPGREGSFVQLVEVTGLRFVHLAGWVADWHEDALATPRALTVVQIAPPLARAVSPWAGTFALHGNLAHVYHGELRELRGGRDGQPGLPLEAAAFRDPHAAVVEPRDDGGAALLRAYRLPEGPVLFRQTTLPSGAVTAAPLVEVEIADEPWQRVDHLHGSEAFDRHFVATADEDGSLWLHFGDGLRGAAVPLAADAPAGGRTAPARLQARYRVGDPIAGNCGAGALRRFVPEEGAQARVEREVPGLCVVNVLPGRGGRERESLDAARLRVPASLRHGAPERAVTPADYAAAARAVPGVARATARRLGGPFNAILVLVEPRGRGALDDALAAQVWAHLDALRMTGREHFVVGAVYVPVEVRLAICVEPGAVPNQVRDAALAALAPGTDAAPGWFHPDRMDFGDSLDLDEVLAVVQRVAGVRSVKALSFRRTDVSGGRAVVRHVALGPAEVIRMDADPLFPERGRLEVLVTGLDEGVSPGDFLVARPPVQG
jgi:hypothetical protein